MRAHKLYLYIIVSGLVFFPAVFDNCSIHDPERNHQWELMSAPLRLALLLGGAGTGAARSCNACTRVPAAGSRPGVAGGEGEQAGAMRAGTSRRAEPPERVPGPAAPGAARAVRRGPEVTAGTAPVRPSAASASCGPPHRGLRCRFVICERTGRSESGTVKGQLVLRLSGRGEGEGGPQGKAARWEPGDGRLVLS